MKRRIEGNRKREMDEEQELENKEDREVLEE